MSISDKSNAQFMAPQYLKTANDCARIVNSTKNPEVFFSRYQLLIDKLEQLAALEKYIKFSGTKPSKQLIEIKRKRDLTIHDFLVRYFDDTKGKIESAKTSKTKYNNAQKFNTEISYHIHELSKYNIEEFNRMSQELFDLCESADPTAKRAPAAKSASVKTETIAKPAYSRDIPEEIADWPWYISLSFGNSTSANFSKALFLAKAANYYLETETDGNKIYQAFYKSDPSEYLKFIQLYELVGNWKSAFVIINGSLVDRKIIGGLNYCYGDRCRSGRKDFCFGASYMTQNPFGCHRLQMSAANNPWWSFSHFDGVNYVIDKTAIRDRAKTFSKAYKLCPCYDEPYVNKVINELPSVLSKSEFQRIAAHESISREITNDEYVLNSQAPEGTPVCPQCGSHDIIYKTADRETKSGCVTLLQYIILLLIPIIGWIAIYQLLKKKNGKEKTGICQNCGANFKV